MSKEKTKEEKDDQMEKIEQEKNKNNNNKNDSLWAGMATLAVFGDSILQ